MPYTPRLLDDGVVVDELVRQAIIPRATYRLQFNKEFTFSDATRTGPYLAQLGISHIY
jgi:(1->4)-alpha-D-glucan 1-alpha-D-glucosylmutase